MRWVIKQFVLLCACLCLYVNAMAQDDAKKVFEGGLIFGANITQVPGDNYTGYHKIGIEAGGQVYVNVSQFLGISMELLYAQKGARGGDVEQSVIVGTFINKYYLNLNYAEVPLLLHIKVGWDLEAGISYARLITANEWAEADVPVVIDPVLNRFNSNDFDYVLGISRPIGKHWHASIRYEYSIKAIRPWDRVPLNYSSGYGVDEYNEVAVIRLVYML